MSRIAGSNTGPEIVVRKLLHGMGYRFRLHVKSLPGTPDIVLPRHKKIILVHGCFWHGHPGCHRSKRPDSNVEFWNKKLSGNRERDEKTQQALTELGWDVLVIWSCEVRKHEQLIEKMKGFLHHGTAVETKHP